MKTGAETLWKEIGRTEVAANTLNPSFVTLVPAVSIARCLRREMLARCGAGNDYQIRGEKRSRKSRLRSKA